MSVAEFVQIAERTGCGSLWPDVAPNP